MDNNLKTIVINLFSLLVVLGFITGLVACHDEDDIDFNAPSITIVSPSPGSDVTSLSVLVTGTVSSDVVLVELTYGDVTDTATLTGTTFSGTVTLVPGANSISAKARDAVGNRNTVTFNLQYPQLTLTDGQAAAFVLGQADFVSNQPNQGTTAAANTLSGVQASLYEKGYTTLYIPDSANNRILGFDAIPSVSNTSANFVLGQPDFASVAAGLSATQFDLPSGVYTTMTQFFLADTNNNRVLIWDSHPTNNSVAAAHVIGQLDFISSTPNCSSSTLMGPTSVFVVNDKVVVLDKGNHRVLIWNAIPDADGVAADVVLGQVGMDSCAANDIDGDEISDTLTASTLSNPGGIWTDGTRLLVADTDNNRVLVWDTFPTTNGQAADWVIGQADMTSSAAPAPPDENSLNAPLSVTSNGNQIIIADSGNNRVLIYNNFPAAIGPTANPADNVIGQGNFTDTNVGISETQMTSYDAVYVDRNRLFVVDSNRVLVFSNPVVP